MENNNLLNPERGKVYLVKHSSGVIRARFIEERVIPGHGNYRSRSRYLFQNLATGRDIVIKSRVKIRREVEGQ